MLPNDFVSIAALAILVEPWIAAGLNLSERRMTRDKRSPAAHVVTIWETLYVIEGHETHASDRETVTGTGTTAMTPLLTSNGAPVTAISSPALPSSATQPSSSPASSMLDLSGSESTRAKSSSRAITSESAGKKGNYHSTRLSGKRGLAYNDAALANAFSDACVICTWGYNWGSARQGLKPGLRYIPMLWGDMPVHISHWDADAERAISQGAKLMFSFNEPDNHDQANMTPQAAAEAHMKYFNRYAGRVKIGAPSVTNSGGAGQGIQWLQSFMKECGEKCPVDFCNVHWYSEAEHWHTLFDHLRKAHEACRGKPIWLTEFAPVSGDTKEFLQNVIPKLESLEYLEGYAYYMVSTGSLMSGSNTLSFAGKLYAA
ncbi:hypothetical protein PCL_08350 [Purpureocillium lilacinum]|uniref:Asl1-like glycosyl hydrolase catalytic domain-containing protein n=1 Tax=Purpureocillium lilacinum TaxID=33203 RepID=A0A2U3DRV1_PURLI|nr:hypothetical protein PCL_08350 [Purpureocillium lilacinum]